MPRRTMGQPNQLESDPNSSTEGGEWPMVKKPMAVDQAQLNLFTAVYLMDARPVQRLNDQLVRESP